MIRKNDICDESCATVSSCRGFRLPMNVSRRRRTSGACYGKKFRKWATTFIFAVAVVLYTLLIGDKSSLTVLTRDEKDSLNAFPGEMANITSSSPLPRDLWPEGDTRDRKIIWSRARTDRSGATIQDMLMCHAFAYQNDFHYAGACARNMAWKAMKIFNGHKPHHEELLEAIGLSKVLRFECPQSNRTPLRDRNDYIKNDTAIFTPDYLDHLHRIIEYPAKPERRTISVHIRRGDISPCRPRTRGYPRYLPNQHFLRLLDRYDADKNSDVVIYSESQSFESFQEFEERGYKLVLDGSIGDVWKGILVSDVVILSRSSFSLVPAVMTKGKVVFTPFWHEPLPHWDVVEEEFLNETLTKFRQLKAACPNKKGKKE